MADDDNEESTRLLLLQEDTQYKMDALDQNRSMSINDMNKSRINKTNQEFFNKMLEKQPNGNSSFKGVARDKVLQSIVLSNAINNSDFDLQFKKEDPAGDNICKYNPRYFSVERKAPEFKFDYGPLAAIKEKSDVKLC